MRFESELPAQCIIFDRETLQAPFYLSLETEDGCKHIELAHGTGFAMSLPAAVAVCVRDGYNPTHYYEYGQGIHPIPRAIPREPAPAAANNAA
ncbi:hypothetical protein [Sphingomonas sp. 3-13AW]|uniref:hypothetical protein n=1 Tax=Sphingomonas sp. 3-13AW TaxID=3050450 RepID=UPI003BB7B303